MTIRRAPTLKTGIFSRFQFGESEREAIGVVRGIKKPHAQKFGDREHEVVGKKNCIRNNHSKSPHSPSPNFECEDILDSKRH